jgi:oligopeptide transport system permease protein
MARYLGRRVISGLLTIWIIATLTFAMMHSIPGDPFSSEKKIPEAILYNLKEKYHLNDPLWKQYVIYLGNVARWDLGPSIANQNRTVNDIINQGFPISATIGGWAIIVALVVGVPLGVVAALNRDRWPDHFVTVLTTIGISQPGFIIATLLQFFIAVKLELFPVALWADQWREPGDGWKFAALPVVALSFFPLAYFARLVRSAMLEVLNQDYMRTARAKGLPSLLIIIKHALRNAVLSLITVLGPQAAAILTGSLVIERIFAIPGLGREFVVSIFNRDYMVIMGVTIFYAALIVLFNLAVDIAYTLVDPRIKIAD